MKILVLGSTGLTGRHLLKKLLASGQDVTAFARKPDDLKEFTSLRVLQGDARDLESLQRAVEGQDVVLSTLGPRSMKADDLQEVYMRNLVQAMKTHGVKRFINLSALGAGDSRKEAPFFFRAILMPLFLGNVFADKEKGEAFLLSSDHNFINVRPGRLLNSPARGGVKASLHGHDIQASLTREDLADFMISQIHSDTWLRQSPLIGY